MPHERPERGETTPQLINRIQADLDRRPYDERERDRIIAELEVALALTIPGSANHTAITQVLKDIMERYGK